MYWMWGYMTSSSLRTKKLLSMSSFFRNNIKTTDFSLRWKNKIASWGGLLFAGPSNLCPAPSTRWPQRFSHTCAQTDLILSGVEEWISGPLSGTRRWAGPYESLWLWRKNCFFPGPTPARLTCLSLSNGPVLWPAAPKSPAGPGQSQRPFSCLSKYF